MNSDDETIVDAGARTPPQGSSFADGHDHLRTEELEVSWTQFLRPGFSDKCTARRVVVKAKLECCWDQNNTSDILAPNLEELRVSCDFACYYAAACSTLLRIRAQNLQVLEVFTCRHVWSACEAGHLQSLRRLIVREYPYLGGPVYADLDEVIRGLEHLPNLTHLELPSPLARRVGWVTSGKAVDELGVADLPNLVHVKIFAKDLPDYCHTRCEAFLRHIKFPPTTTIDVTDILLHPTFMDKPVEDLINRIVSDGNLSFHTLMVQISVHPQGWIVAVFEAYAMKGPPQLRLRLGTIYNEVSSMLDASTASFRGVRTLELVFSPEYYQPPAAVDWTSDMMVSLKSVSQNVTHLRLRVGEFEVDEDTIRQLRTMLPHLEQITVCDVSPDRRVIQCIGERRCWDIPSHSEGPPCVITVNVTHCKGFCKAKATDMRRGVFSNGRMGDAAKVLLQGPS